jgi:uncharacterized protein YyaL (SSP411 family)
LADYQSTHNPSSREAVTRTLDAMAFGGIRDHLGGGFHRYSTDPTWSVPHFEKMLYDNAQLLKLYAEAYQATGVVLYRQVAEEVARYLSEQVMAPDGGFYAAQDAEVAGREGASYLWKRREIVSILGQEPAERFFRVYALAPVPAQNERNVIADDEEGVLRVRVPIPDVVARVGGSDIASVLASLAPARTKLLAVRQHRAQPPRDEKIIVAWNALAIDALVRTGQILDSSRTLAAARESANEIWKQAYDPKTGELKHEIFRGRAQIEGYLDDYALLGIAFLSLGEATSGTLWRDRSEQLAASMLRRFARGGAYVTALAASDLPIQPQEDGDNTLPSGTSAAIELLLRLHAATGKSEYAAAGSTMIARVASILEQAPGLWPTAVAAINRYPLPAPTDARRDVATAGPAGNVAVPGSAAYVHAAGEIRSVGEHEEITVTVLVDKGYHVNANPASFDYLIPTRLSLAGAPGLRVSYPEPTMFEPTFAPEGLKVYEGKVTLRATAPKGALVEGQATTAELKVQACNDEICLPPATLPLRIERR